MATQTLNRLSYRIGKGLAFLLVPLFVISASAQTCRDLFGPDWAAGNPTAALSWEQYAQPNGRDLSEYNDIVGARKRWPKAKSLVQLVPRGGLALDVGGGRGQAMHDMATEAELTAVVINTQEVPLEALINRGMNGRLIYRKGWAQDVLKEYESQADLILDIWGGFSYEMDKARILDLIYAALKPGGRAFILYHPFKTPALVNTGRGATMEIDAWLEHTHPKIFSWYQSPGQRTSLAHIIEIHKPEDGSGPESIGLRLVKGDLIKSKANSLPQSTFEPVERHR